MNTQRDEARAAKGVLLPEQVARMCGVTRDAVLKQLQGRRKGRLEGFKLRPESKRSEWQVYADACPRTPEQWRARFGSPGNPLLRQGPAMRRQVRAGRRGLDSARGAKPVAYTGGNEHE